MNTIFNTHSAIPKKSLGCGIFFQPAATFSLFCIIISRKCLFLNIFSEGLAYARIGDTHGCINHSGNFEFQKPVTKPTLLDKLRGRKDWLRW